MFVYLSYLLNIFKHEDAIWNKCIWLCYVGFTVLASCECLAQTTGAMRHVLHLHNFFRRIAAREENVANMNMMVSPVGPCV